MDGLKKWLLIIAVSFFMAGAFSLCDVVWPQECGELVRVTGQTGGTVTLVVLPVHNSGTDSHCAFVAWCFREIIDSPGVDRLEIANPADEWVPSIWRSLDLCKVRALNEPWEDYALFPNIEAFLDDCYEGLYAQHDFWDWDD